MPTGATMKKKGHPEPPDAEGTRGIAIRGSKEWRDWVMAFADFRRLKATDLIDQALVEYAERHGFKPPAPKR